MNKSMTNSFKVERETVGHVQLFSTQKLSTTEDEYLLGYEAAQNNLDEEQNPFKMHSRAHGNWSDGWWDGFYNEAPRFSSLSETIIPFPIKVALVKEPKPENKLAAIAQNTKQQWQCLSKKINFFNQPKMDIVFEVFTAIFLVGVTYELLT